jgi:carbon-monoxide dehydrogenase medium subunit
VKAAPFAYVRPGTLDEAVAELGRDGAKVLAGGQSLVPVLAMRLGRPATLVDINAVEELNRLVCRDGLLRVGATVRQRHLLRDDRSAQVPLLRLALPWVGHREIRSRGTVCGSLAHADPSEELPAVAVCLDATLVVAGPRGAREVPASEFFTGAMSTAVQADELLTEVRFPVAHLGEGYGFAEFARRHGDFALAGVAVKVVARNGDVTAAATCFGVSDRPVRADMSDQLRHALSEPDGTPTEHELREALTTACAELADRVVDTGGDSHASPAYRRQLVAALASRELSRAYLKSNRIVGSHRP